MRSKYFFHANVINTSKRVYEIFENSVIKFNNTSRTSAIRFVSENEWKKKEADVRHRQLVQMHRKKREKKRDRERENYAQRILFYFISSNSDSILCFIYFPITSHSYGIHINHRTVELPCNIPPQCRLRLQATARISWEESDGIRVSL